RHGRARGPRSGRARLVDARCERRPQPRRSDQQELRLQPRSSEAMDPLRTYIELETRRQFFGRTAKGLGVAALASLLGSTKASGASAAAGGALPRPHFAPRAKRAIYLFMSGAPSQMDLFDYKPKMDEYFDKDLPESIRMGQRLTTDRKSTRLNSSHVK